jgi:hypothetical protein
MRLVSLMRLVGLMRHVALLAGTLTGLMLLAASRRTGSLMMRL